MATEADIDIAAIDKNSRETLRVALGTFKDHKLCQIRVWARGDKGPIPTKSGFGIRVELLPELRKALEEAERMAGELGWLGASRGQS
jgi:hypothetical protein